MPSFFNVGEVVTKLYIIVFMDKHNVIEKINCSDIEEVPKSNKYYDYCKKIVDYCT